MFKGAIDQREFYTLLVNETNRVSLDDVEDYTLLGLVEDLCRRARLGASQHNIPEHKINPVPPLREYMHEPRLSHGGLMLKSVPPPTANETTLVMPKIQDDDPLYDERLPFEPDNVGLDILEDRDKL